MKRKTAHTNMKVIPRTTLLYSLAVLLCITSSSLARESVRDQFRSLKSSGAEINNNNDKQCTTPGSCANDDSNYAAAQINHGRNNGRKQQQQGGRNDLRKRLARKLQEEDNNDRDYDDEEGMDLRAKLDARLARYESSLSSSNSRPLPKQQQQSRGGNRPPNKSHNNNNMPSANKNNNNDNGIYYKIPGEDPAFLRYLSNLEVYEVPEMRQALGEILEEMEASVGGITTLMQRHVERTLIEHQFPNGGGGSGSTVKYANFGSLLDVSTAYSVSWNGSTEFGGKPSWVASIFYRKDILKYEKSKPCRVDLKDDYDPEVGDDECCLLGVTIEDFVGVRPSRQKKEEHMELSAYWDILDHGKWRMGTILDMEFGNQKFDTIVANGALTGEDSEIVLIMEKLKSLLKPGGVVFFVGHEPPPEKADGPEKIHNEILQVIESAKRLAGEEPTRNVPATFINENLDRLGLNVFSSTHFQNIPTLEEIRGTTNDGKKWINESKGLKPDVKKETTAKLDELLKRMSRVAKVSRGVVLARQYEYVIAAELPIDHGKKKSSVTEPTIYQPKTKA